MSSIFISYRQAETRHVAGRLYDHLTTTFGRDSIFRDVYTIQAGADFPTSIQSAVAKAEVVVVLIDERWSTITDGEGRRRLDDPDDWVRLEIAAALEHKKLVVPVLVEGARMPAEKDLPGALRALTRCQAIELSDRRFQSDVAELIKVLRERAPDLGSQELRPGAFRGLGTFHVHIDGADEAHVESTLGELGPEFPSKVNRVSGNTVFGPQRKDPDFDRTYRYHTPSCIENDEEFSVFSTTLLGTGPELQPEALKALKDIIATVTSRRGPVVEFERVVATIDEDGVWREEELIADPPQLWTLADDYPRLSTFPIEIHHAIDIPKESGVPPLNLVEDLPRGPNLGSWFFFEKKDVWAYRSNQFADWSDYEHYAKDGDARMRSFVAELQTRGLNATLRTLVEQVLGIWRRDDDLRREDFKSVPDLARWEMEAPGEFWVIAANFLGDKSPDVKNAMVRNLKRNVTYTYFVRSYADVFRLDMLRKELEDKLSGMPRGSPEEAQRIVSKQIRCVLLRGMDESLEELLERDYFLYPRGTDEKGVEGYKLHRGSIGGQKLDNTQITKIIAGLKPVLEQKVEGFYLSVSHDAWRKFDELKRYAIVSTDLASSEAPVGLKRWQQRLALYDRIVAREVSQFHHGDVVRPVRNGYLLVFWQVRDAAEFASRLQSAMRWHNEAACRAGHREHELPPQNISLEFGLATRVLRAHGDDYVGEAIDKCIGRLDACRETGGDLAGAIAVSDEFASSYIDELGEEPFAGRPRNKKRGWMMIGHLAAQTSD